MKNIQTDRKRLGERSSPEKINKEARYIYDLYQKAQLKFSSGNGLLILNKNRQIVYANDDFFKLVGHPKKSQLYGLRPGEALKCTNASNTTRGCGTSDACAECGTFLTILSGLQGKEMESECRIIQKGTNEAFDFAVHSFPLDYEGNPFVAISIKDISDVKRREVLERIFLHDLLNAAGGIQGLSSVLLNLPENERERAIEMIHQASTELVEEIQGQKQLLHAEKGDLQPIVSETTTTSVIEKQIALYSNHSITKKRSLVLCPKTINISITTDASLLGRVIGNLIKNALEASDREGTVFITCKKINKNHIEFSVHNETFISKEDQLKIFQRSFSTKGKGRGIGTYCIKLLTENYLQGKVRFESSKDKGTTFYVEIPLIIS